MNFKKESLVAALYHFRNELKDIHVDEKEKLSLMNEFARWFERSDDYDLASSRVFDRLMSQISRKSNFKDVWKNVIDRKRTIHFSDLDLQTYISIRDQLKDLIKRKYPYDPESAALQISKEYNIFYTDVFHLAFNLTNKNVNKRVDFKKVWNFLSNTFKKQEKGDTVTWDGKKYKVEDVKEGKNDENIYTICRMESSDGVSIQLNCLKILATEGEIQVVKSYSPGKRLAISDQMNPNLSEVIRDKINDMKEDGYDDRSIAFVISGLYNINIEDALNVVNILPDYNEIN